MFHNNLQLDFSGDGEGSGYEELSSVHLHFPIDAPHHQLESVDDGAFEPIKIEDDRILWRDTFGDLRKESEAARIVTLLNHINTDGMPEQFRRLTSEYLSEMIHLISKRLGAAPFDRHLTECTDRLPETFYRLNYAAYDSLRHCPHCISDIGVKYVNSVHGLVLDLFKCLDSHIRPPDQLSLASSSTARK